MREEFNNRRYESKYDNETRKFLHNLMPHNQLKELASLLETSYVNLHNATKNNKIPSKIACKIKEKINLTPTQLETLYSLTIR